MGDPGEPAADTAARSLNGRGAAPLVARPGHIVDSRSFGHAAWTLEVSGGGSPALPAAPADDD